MGWIFWVNKRNVFLFQIKWNDHLPSRLNVIGFFGTGEWGVSTALIFPSFQVQKDGPKLILSLEPPRKPNGFASGCDTMLVVRQADTRPGVLLIIFQKTYHQMSKTLFKSRFMQDTINLFTTLAILIYSQLPVFLHNKGNTINVFLGGGSFKLSRIWVTFSILS